MQVLLLITVLASVLACKRSSETTQTKMSPSTSARTWWFDVALDEERFNPAHDEERSPAPAREKGEQVKLAVQLALVPTQRDGTLKIKYMHDPTDCELLELSDVDFYDNGDMEVSFRAQGKHARELRGIFSEESQAALDTPYHEKFFFHLKIMQTHADGMASLFSMNDAASFNLTPDKVRADYFTEDDHAHCQKAESVEKR